MEKESFASVRPIGFVDGSTLRGGYLSVPPGLFSAASLQDDVDGTRPERRCYDRGASDDTPTK
jgi:hypothetical protein